MYPFRQKKPNKKRTETRRVRDRIRLYSEKKTELRREVFNRSGGRCEEIVFDPGCEHTNSIEFQHRCYNTITWESMHLSHDRHGPRKSDTLETCKASCRSCHTLKHNGGKPVPRRPGRIMSKSEARKYLRGKLCVCGAAKRQDTAFCESCNAYISAQSRMNLEELHNNEWLSAFSDAEKELLCLTLSK